MILFNAGYGLWILMIFQCLKYEHIYSGFNFNFCHKSFILRGNRLFHSVLKNQKGELLYLDVLIVNWRVAKGPCLMTDNS